MSKVITKECAGCGKEFHVLPIKEVSSLYCTKKCEKEHSIFDSKK